MAGLLKLSARPTLTRTEVEAAPITKIKPIVLPESEGLSFKPKLVGFQLGYLNERMVEGWQVEEMTDFSKLPFRAQQRLAEFASTGVGIKQVVLYHELPKGPSALQVASGKILMGLAKLIGVGIGVSALVFVGLLLVAGVAAGVMWASQWMGHILAGVGVVAAVGAVSTVAALDPVLVVQTNAGSWLELDRWDD